MQPHLTITRLIGRTVLSIPDGGRCRRNEARGLGRPSFMPLDREAVETTLSVPRGTFANADPMYEPLEICAE